MRRAGNLQTIGESLREKMEREEDKQPDYSRLLKAHQGLFDQRSDRYFASAVHFEQRQSL